MTTSEVNSVFDPNIKRRARAKRNFFSLHKLYPQRPIDSSQAIEATIKLKYVDLITALIQSGHSYHVPW